MKIKYPTKKQLEKRADEHRTCIESDFIGTGLKVDCEQAYDDFSSDVKLRSGVIGNVIDNPEYVV